MPRWVSSPFQNFGSRLALVGRPTPNAVKFINIWLDLQLPGRRSNPWAKFLGMPVPFLCLGLSIPFADAISIWLKAYITDETHSKCGAISQNTRSGLVCWSLDGDLILEPNFWKCLWFAYAKASLMPIPELWLKASLTSRSTPNAVEFLKTTNMRLGLWPEI